MHIMQRIKSYIYQKPDWPYFTWRSDVLIPLLSEVRNLQGRLMGKMESLGFQLKNEALLDTLTRDVLKTSEIEGEILNSEEVRSSIARRLGIELAGAVDSERNVDGVVEMMLDATQNCFQALTKERLFNWHAALFPIGRSGMYPIRVANWRQDSTGPMQVVSGGIGKECVHFQAPDSVTIEQEMHRFLGWYNEENQLDLVLKASIAHLWFITIHPFDDGNGRIARALTDTLLARSDKSNQRFYSMSAQIRIERKHYYEILESTQEGSLDVTRWILWFLECLSRSLKNSEELLSRILAKARFWNINSEINLNARQKLMLNKVLDGFEGNLNSSKWSKITKCSKDSAIRDINELIQHGILEKAEAGGRSVSYRLLYY